jgi:ubiquinone biosynthesis protein
VLKMIIEDGFFHADPHPGNLFYLPGHRIAFIDFGMVGRLDEQRRRQLVGLLLGLAKLDAPSVAGIVMDWAATDLLDEEALERDIDSFIDHYHGVPLGDLQFGAMLNEVVAILRQHHLALPSDLSLLIKAFITLEGMGRELDPGFDMAGQALPMLERAVRQQYAPQEVLRRGWRSAREALALLAGLPGDLTRLLRAARRGRLEIHIDVPDVKDLGHQLDRAVSRLVVGVVVAALIIGSSIVMTVSGGPELMGLPLFGLMGFAGAVAGSIWLLASIWNSNRPGRAR